MKHDGGIIHQHQLGRVSRLQGIPRPVVETRGERAGPGAMPLQVRRREIHKGPDCLHSQLQMHTNNTKFRTTKDNFRYDRGGGGKKRNHALKK